MSERSPWFPWIVALCFLTHFSRGQQDRSPPNFLLLLADDLGYGDLETFGHPTSIAPNLIRLASESLVLTNFYAASALCSPSRASLLTGLYPISTGVYPGVFFPDSVGGLPPSIPNVASELKNMGYNTGLVGKWHLGVGQDGAYLPTNQGFQSYFGIPYAHDMCPCPVCFPGGEPCILECHSQYVGCPLMRGDRIVEQPVDFPTLTDKYTGEAKAFMEASIDEGHPFFLYMAYQHTHHPQFASARFRNSSDRGAFGDALVEMDASIGEIVSFLEERNLMSNTFIFFSSDNGLMRHGQGGSAGGFRCGKATTWEGGMRVPAMLRFDGHIAPGRSHSLASNLDVFPSLISLAKGSLPISTSSPAEAESAAGHRRTQGFDLSRFLLGQDVKSPRDHFVYFPIVPTPEIGPYAIRYSHYKAAFYTEGALTGTLKRHALSDDSNYDQACRGTSDRTKHDPPLMFDLNIDPGERYPLPTNSSEYLKYLEPILQIKKDAEKSIVWAPSEMDRGVRPELEPCCSSQAVVSNRYPRGDKASLCSPFPECCNCRHSPQDSSSEDLVHGVEIDII